MYHISRYMNVFDKFFVYSTSKNYLGNICIHQMKKQFFKKVEKTLFENENREVKRL